jgi:hypothetical protein
MHISARPAAALALSLLAGTCLAQAVAPKAPPPAATAARPAQTVTKTVLEDDAVRIEETRLRGQAQRIQVRSKLPGVKDYEIIVAPGAQDSSQDRGAAGKRAWSLFAF